MENKVPSDDDRMKAQKAVNDGLNYMNDRRSELAKEGALRDDLPAMNPKDFELTMEESLKKRRLTDLVGKGVKSNDEGKVLEEVFVSLFTEVCVYRHVMKSLMKKGPISSSKPKWKPPAPESYPDRFNR